MEKAKEKAQEVAKAVMAAALDELREAAVRGPAEDIKVLTYAANLLADIDTGKIVSTLIDSPLAGWTEGFTKVIDGFEISIKKTEGRRQWVAKVPVDVNMFIDGILLYAPTPEDAMRAVSAYIEQQKAEKAWPPSRKPWRPFGL